jgi:uncharacterized Zn-finger protein
MSDPVITAPGAGLPADPAPETIASPSKRVRCDGGGGPLGHPVVYYDMGEDAYVECLYCDRRFVYAPVDGETHDH